MAGVAGQADGVRLGVDLGGTKLRAALAAADGAILAEGVEATVSGSAADIASQVLACRDALAAQAGVPVAEVVAAGIALPVAIDPRSGHVWSTANVPGLREADPTAALERALACPVVFENDANCAALGEGRLGAARGEDDFVVIAIGTGIGGGIVSGGRLLRGARGGAAEIAFLPLGANPWEPSSRDVGAYERAVAGPAIVDRVGAALAGGEPSTLVAGARLEAIATAAAAGDLLAARLLDEEARLVALGIAAVRAVVDPALVVLSGGVGAVAGLLAPVEAHVATLCADPPRIVTGALGERAPLVGALLLADPGPRER